MERPRMSLPLSLYISYQFLDYSQMALRSRLGRESIFSLSLSANFYGRSHPQNYSSSFMLYLFLFPHKTSLSLFKVKNYFLSLSLSPCRFFFFFFFFEVRVSDFNFSLFGSFNFVFFFFFFLPSITAVHTNYQMSVTMSGTISPKPGYPILFNLFICICLLF